MQTGQNEEQEYALAYQRGEEKGFNYFFTMLYPGLLYYAFKITGDKLTAEEIVGDSFVKQWKQHAGFSHPKKIRSWLYTTVKHESINALHKNRRQIENKQKFAESCSETAEPLISEEDIRVASLPLILAEIDKLPLGARQIFILFWLYRKTVEEIAKELGISVNTVKTQKARALKTIRANLS